MQRFLPFLILIFLVLVTFFSNRIPNITNAPLNEHDADFKFYNVTISMHSNGKKQWTINASQSSIFNQSNSFFFHNVNGSLIGDATDVLFSSPTGGYNMSTRKLKLVKTNAEIDFSTYKYFLTCDEIEIDARNNQMVGVGNLFINSEQLMLKGKKMMADLQKNRLEIVKHVEGTFIPSSIN